MADENLNKKVAVEENGIEKENETDVVTNDYGESSDLCSTLPKDGEEAKGDCFYFLDSHYEC